MLQRQPMNYLLPLLSHPAALLCTDAAVAPQAGGRWELAPWPVARQQQRFRPGSGTAQAAAAHAGTTHSSADPPHTTGHQGICSGRMGKWSWGRCSMARAEILGYLQNCDQNKIHWVVLIASFLKHLCFCGVVSENCLCQADSTDMRW